MEIKVPTPEHHFDYWDVGWDPAEETNRMYEAQMNAQMSCTGRKYVDFVSYDPSLPQKHRRLWIMRFERDDKIIRGLELEVQHFLGEVAQKVHDYLALPKVLVIDGAVQSLR